MLKLCSLAANNMGHSSHSVHSPPHCRLSCHFATADFFNREVDVGMDTGYHLHTDFGIVLRITSC